MADDQGTTPTEEAKAGEAPAADTTAAAEEPKKLTPRELEDYRESLRRRFHTA